MSATSKKGKKICKREMRALISSSGKVPQALRPSNWTDDDLRALSRDDLAILVRWHGDRSVLCENLRQIVEQKGLSFADRKRLWHYYEKSTPKVYWTEEVCSKLEIVTLRELAYFRQQPSLSLSVLSMVEQKGFTRRDQRVAMHTYNQFVKYSETPVFPLRDSFAALCALQRIARTSVVKRRVARALTRDLSDFSFFFSSNSCVHSEHCGCTITVSKAFPPFVFDGDVGMSMTSQFGAALDALNLMSNVQVACSNFKQAFLAQPVASHYRVTQKEKGSSPYEWLKPVGTHYRVVDKNEEVECLFEWPLNSPQGLKMVEVEGEKPEPVSVWIDRSGQVFLTSQALIENMSVRHVTSDNICFSLPGDDRMKFLSYGTKNSEWLSLKAWVLWMIEVYGEMAISCSGHHMVSGGRNTLDIPRLFTLLETRWSRNVVPALSAIVEGMWNPVGCCLPPILYGDDNLSGRYPWLNYGGMRSMVDRDVVMKYPIYQSFLGQFIRTVAYFGRYFKDKFLSLMYNTQLFLEDDDRKTICSVYRSLQKRGAEGFDMNIHFQIKATEELMFKVVLKFDLRFTSKPGEFDSTLPPLLSLNDFGEGPSPVVDWEELPEIYFSISEDEEVPLLV